MGYMSSHALIMEAAFFLGWVLARDSLAANLSDSRWLGHRPKSA
ncbi:hypothetical protein CSIRO_4066 [Bradyrhizobiaceae bacterium SG-6C]|nr:hypothetical protein CSIRO_4066 [Bradyrhizobiaceae bacterium SG-6C]